MKYKPTIITTMRLEQSFQISRPRHPKLIASVYHTACWNFLEFWAVLAEEKYSLILRRSPLLISGFLCGFGFPFIANRRHFAAACCSFWRIPGPELYISMPSVRRCCRALCICQPECRLDCLDSVLPWFSRIAALHRSGRGLPPDSLSTLSRGPHLFPAYSARRWSGSTSTTWAAPGSGSFSMSLNICSSICELIYPVSSSPDDIMNWIPLKIYIYTYFLMWTI